MHERLPFRNSRTRGGGGVTAPNVAGILKSKRRHVRAHAFTQHATVHYSTNLSTPTAESWWRRRRRAPECHDAVTVIVDV